MTRYTKNTKNAKSIMNTNVGVSDNPITQPHQPSATFMLQIGPVERRTDSQKPQVVNYTITRTVKTEPKKYDIKVLTRDARTNVHSIAQELAFAIDEWARVDEAGVSANAKSS